MPVARGKWSTFEIRFMGLIWQMGRVWVSLDLDDKRPPEPPGCLVWEVLQTLYMYIPTDKKLEVWTQYRHSFFLSLVATSILPCCVLTPSLRRPCIHAIFFRPPVGQRVNTHSVFWEFFRKPCQHATRGCDKRWMTCIHAGVSRSPREHASVPPDKRHCCQWMSSLFCGFLPNPFIHDLFCWSSRHKFVKTDL